MTVEDIYKRLEAGESDKDIAKELIAMLNKALDMRDKDKEAEEQKHEEAQKVADTINAYFTTYCGYESCLNADDIEALGNVLKNTKVEVIDKPHTKGIKIKTSSGGAGFNPDEIIGDFLDAFRLK